VSNASPDPLAALSSAALNVRAAKAAWLIAQSGMALRDTEARAFEAATRECAHLGHVEVLERTARRAVRAMVQKPVIRFLADVVQRA
jgi:hypothetical protein